jgi:hypothetical protein
VRIPQSICLWSPHCPQNIILLIHPSSNGIKPHQSSYYEILICLYIAEKEFAKGGQMKESMEKQYSKITELEERYQHKMHAAKVSMRKKGLQWTVL